jgi:hypothetical protein
VEGLEATLKDDLSALKSEADIAEIVKFVSNSIKLEHLKLEASDPTLLINLMREPMHAVL